MSVRCRWTSAIAAATLAGACGGSKPPAPVSFSVPDVTWLDCVAVLGGPNRWSPSSPWQLDKVPYSGADRTKTIGGLSDGELAKLADFDICMTMNAYDVEFCTDRYCPPEGADPPVGPFKLETLPFLAGLMATYYVVPLGEAPYPSRWDKMSLLRNAFGACHVAAWEDCTRESGPVFPDLRGYGPDCAERNRICALP